MKSCENMESELVSAERMRMRIDNLEDENERLRDMLNDIAYALGLDMLKVHYYSEDNYTECQIAVLHEIEGRLMPEGMNWPRFDDGEQVHLGDEVYVDCGDYKPFEGEVYEVKLGDGITLYSTDGDFVEMGYHATGIKRPPILAKDDKPIEVGQTLYDYDGHAFEVVALHHGDAYDVEVDGEWHVNACGEKEPKRVKANWLTHKKPVLAADGKPIKVGETVYRVDGVGGAFVVKEVGINPWSKRWDVTVDCVEDRELCTFEPSQLTHEKPILAADGKPIKVGSTLYSKDGRDWHVLNLRRDLLYPVKAEGPAIEGEKLPSHGGRITKLLRADLLTHEKPDTWDSFEHDLFIELSDKSGYSEDVRKEAVAAFVDRAKKLAERMVRNEQQSRIAE